MNEFKHNLQFIKKSRNYIIIFKKKNIIFIIISIYQNCLIFLNNLEKKKKNDINLHIHILDMGGCYHEDKLDLH